MNFLSECLFYSHKYVETVCETPKGLRKLRATVRAARPRRPLAEKNQSSTSERGGASETGSSKPVVNRKKIVKGESMARAR